MILLASRVIGAKKGGQQVLGGLDITVNRNAFGGQVDSFVAELNISFTEGGDGAIIMSNENSMARLLVGASSMASKQNSFEGTYYMTIYLCLFTDNHLPRSFFSIMTQLLIKYLGVFIRAPIISEVGPAVRVLAQVNEKIVSSFLVLLLLTPLFI